MNTCVICLNLIGTKNRCILQCGHSFHDVCLQKWLATHNTCPYCRSVHIQCQHGSRTNHRPKVLRSIINILSATKEGTENENLFENLFVWQCIYAAQFLREEENRIKNTNICSRVSTLFSGIIAHFYLLY